MGSILYSYPSDANLLGVMTMLVQVLYPHPSDANMASGTLKHTLVVYILFNDKGYGPCDITNPFFWLCVVTRKLSLALCISPKC